MCIVMTINARCDMPTTIIGLDPGKRNMGLSVVKIDSKGAYKIQELRMLQHTITDFKSNTDTQGLAFKKEMQKVIKANKVEFIIAERFMVRGRFNGASCEYISAMLGILTILPPTTCFITAAQWKNAFNKSGYDLKAVYKDVKLVPHLVDAALIGLYGASKFTDTTAFNCVKNINTLTNRLKVYGK